MKSVILPGGETVPALGQGSWMMGERADRREAETAALRAGVECGMTLIDTAEMYGDGAAETVALILSTGGRAESLVVDVTDDAAMEAGIAGVLARHGRIDILHNHAGAQVEGDLETVAIDGFDRSWDLNVRAHFIAARLVVPAMKAAGGGVIVNTSSSSGILYDREMIAYTTTKHAVIAMTKQMAGEALKISGARAKAGAPVTADELNADHKKNLPGDVLAPDTLIDPITLEPVAAK